MRKKITQENPLRFLLRFLLRLFYKFSEVFRSLSNLERSRFLGAGRNFRTSIGSFRFTSSWDSEVILLSQRLALKYNTIRRATLQAFFTSFLLFFRFCIHPLVFCLKSVPALTPTPHTCGVQLLPVGGSIALYIIRRASAAFTGQTDALYNSYFWAYTCLRCSVRFIFSL